MADSLALYVRLVSARVRAQWQYRASFALDVLGVFLVSFLDFIAILVIFDNVPQLGGWSVQEVALLYGIAGVSFSIAELAVGHLDLLPQLIRDGNFDLVLVRPRNSLLQVIVSDFRLRQFGRLLQSIVVLVYAIVALDIGWTADRVAMIVVAVLAGAAIFAAIWVAGITIVFWAVEGRESVNSFTDGGNFLSEYPIDVYAAGYSGSSSSWSRSRSLRTSRRPTSSTSPIRSARPTGCRSPRRRWRSWRPWSRGYVWRNAVRHYRSAGG